jgi:YMGG-like Gly-zipper
MKKSIFGLFVAAALFTACNSKQDSSTATVPMQNPFYNPLYENGSDFSFAQRIMMESPQYIAWRKQKIEDDRIFNEQLESKAEELETTKPVNKKPTAKATAKNTVSNTTNNTTNSTTTTTAEQPATKRKGWSNAAKGTVIGAGSGAVVGVIVSKDKIKGGVIGGLLGAGVGYVIGNEKDKKKKTN